MGTGVRAAAGLIAPGSRRVVVKARYTRIINGDLGAARAHLKYIQRDGVTREGSRGSAYDANRDDVDQGAFLERSKGDPHQFRIILSPEDGDRLHDLKPLVRDLLGQMERDLGTRLDWVAVDHFNTGHPHSHIVIRGKDDQGRDLVMARDYIGHGIRSQETFTLAPWKPVLEPMRGLAVIGTIGQRRRRGRSSTRGRCQVAHDDRLARRLAQVHSRSCWAWPRLQTVSYAPPIVHMTVARRPAALTGRGRALVRGLNV